VEAPVATGQFLKEARRRGAKVLYPCEVQAIELRGGRLAAVTTTQGRFALDHLVSAAGIDTPRVMALAGYPIGLLHAPGLVVHTTPLPPLTRMAYEASGVLEFKQMRDGRIAADYAAGPPDAPQHVGIRDHVMAFPSEALQKAHGDSVLRKTVAYIPAAAAATPQKVMLCFRPMPMDRMPVVGAVPGAPGLYVVVTHSGVTLAPILGEYVAHEVLSGIKAPMLAPYRPDRFAAKAQLDVLAS
jgi:glycine/D-amino acid oxidase-like deaminating enzyme